MYSSRFFTRRHFYHLFASVDGILRLSEASLLDLPRLMGLIVPSMEKRIRCTMANCWSVGQGRQWALNAFGVLFADVSLRFATLFDS